MVTFNEGFNKKSREDDFEVLTNTFKEALDRLDQTATNEEFDEVSTITALEQNPKKLDEYLTKNPNLSPQAKHVIELSKEIKKKSIGNIEDVRFDVQERILAEDPKSSYYEVHLLSKVGNLELSIDSEKYDEGGGNCLRINNHAGANDEIFVSYDLEPTKRFFDAVKGFAAGQPDVEKVRFFAMRLAESAEKGVKWRNRFNENFTYEEAFNK